MLAAFTITELGSWAYIVVLGVYIYEQTGSASMLAVLAAIRWAASLVVSPYAGVIADRYERRLVLVVCTLASSILLLATTVVVAAEGPIWLLLITSTLTTISFVPDRPAASAMIPEIVDEDTLVTANVMINVIENLVIVIGPLVGGALMLSDRDAAAIARTRPARSLWETSNPSCRWKRRDSPGRPGIPQHPGHAVRIGVWYTRTTGQGATATPLSPCYIREPGQSNRTRAGLAVAGTVVGDAAWSSGAKWPGWQRQTGVSASPSGG